MSACETRKPCFQHMKHVKRHLWKPDLRGCQWGLPLETLLQQEDTMIAMNVTPLYHLGLSENGGSSNKRATIG